MNWYTSLGETKSKGSQTKRPNSLAGLSEARKIHLGQFWTSTSLAKKIWSIALPALEKINTSDHKASIFDNSIGNGRLIQFADANKHAIYGVEKDKKTALNLSKTLKQAGFTYLIENTGMEKIRAKRMNIALINPPFSLHLESPLMQSLPCTTFGLYGPSTSANSTAYSIEQALESSNVVIAIIPSSFSQRLSEEINAHYLRRLKAIIKVPSNLFIEEGTKVGVELLVFDIDPPHGEQYKEQFITLDSLNEELPDFDLNCGIAQPVELKKATSNKSEPSITLPVTHENEVRIAHNQSKIILNFKCGLTQARVLNGIYKTKLKPLDNHRYPNDITYTGEGALNIELHLMQDDPEKSLNALFTQIEKHKGKPIIDVGLINYFKKRIRQHKINATPIKHTVFLQSGQNPFRNTEIATICRETHTANKKWGSSTIIKGTEIAFKKIESSNLYEAQITEKETLTLNLDHIQERFKIVDKNNEEIQGQWETIYEGREKAFPETAHQWRSKAKKMGIDKWLSWGFQLDDAIEALMAPKGTVLAEEMGLGKSRLALSIIMLGGGVKNLLVTEAYLIDEMIIELNKLGVDKSVWQIIKSPEELSQLKQINIISYSMLRAKINKAKKSTYANKLRRRIALAVFDEGDVLRNIHSQQTRAAWAISPKKKIILSGTPIGNYPRDVHPLISFVAGHGNACQRYGLHGKGYLEKHQISSLNHAKRGVDEFRSSFVTLEWVTNQFKESNSNGAKREIPRIKDLPLYREIISCHVKRRITQEPDVKKHIYIPVATFNNEYIEWDNDHLAYYIKVAEEFVQWYMRHRKEKAKRGKNTNLVAVLARIKAVEMAVAIPQKEIKSFGSFAPKSGLTSKQRHAVDYVERMVEQGHKVILYAKNPQTLEVLSMALSGIGIEQTIMHGGINIDERTKALNTEFRYGPKPVLLATLGVVQKGLNIPQANRVYVYDIDWTDKTGKQAIARVLRPQQTRKVEVTIAHLVGSIDIYKQQMTAFKADSISAGLDWGAAKTSNQKFIHMDTILYAFCDEFAKQHGLDRNQLKEIA